MSATLLVATLLFTTALVDQEVTADEKKEFFKLLTTLPTKGEFFTEEGVKKAIPHTRVLLSLSEKDLEKCALYPFMALSSGLLGHKEPRQYAEKNFAKIAHPTIKLAWAIGLLDDKAPSQEILSFLRKALDSEKDAKTLSSMLGPGFEDFKDRVIRLDAGGKRTRVELVKEHTIQGFPEYGGGFDYTKETCVACQARCFTQCGL